MKLFLLILLTCVSTLNGENKIFNEKKLQKMIAHIRKIRNLEAGAGGDESNLSGESGSKPYEEEESKPYQESQRQPNEEDESRPYQEYESRPYQESQRQSNEEDESQPYQESQRQSNKEAESQSYQESQRQPNEEDESRPYQEYESRPYQESQRQSNEEYESRPYQESQRQSNKEDESQSYQESQRQSNEEDESRPYQESQRQSNEEYESRPYQESQRQSNEEDESRPYQESQRQSNEEYESRPYQESQRQSNEEDESQSYQESQRQPNKEAESQSYQESQRQPNEEYESRPYQEYESRPYQESQRQSNEEYESQPYQEYESQSYQESQRQSIQEYESQSYQESQRQSIQEYESQSYQESQSQSTQEYASQSYQESGSQQSQESQIQSSQESNSSIINVPDTTTTTPYINITSPSAIEILGFNSFKQEPTKITFITSFIFKNKLPPKIIKFILTLYYESNLQEKSVDKTSECLIIGEPSITNEIVSYNCEAPKEDAVEVEQVVVNPGFTLENNGVDTMEDVHFSQEASATSENLQEQTRVINKMLKLNNGELITNSTYFIIEGTIDKLYGKVGDDLTLVVYDNTTYPTTPQNVSCKIQTAKASFYEIKCTQIKGVRGTIHLSPMYTGDTSIILNMTYPHSDFINYMSIQDSNTEIKLLGFNNFRQEPENITFTTNFFFDHILPPKTIRFTLTIFYGSSLQEKKANQTSECLIIEEPSITKQIVSYNCKASKENDDEIKQIVVNQDFKFENGEDKMEETSPNSEDVSFSEEAVVTSQNLQNQTQMIKNMIKLENGELINNSTYFIIKGDIDKYDGRVGEALTLVVYNSNPVTIQNIPCKTESIEGTKYEFKCTPDQEVKGSLYLSTMYAGDASITLNITEPNSHNYLPSNTSSNTSNTTSNSTPAFTPSIQILDFNSFKISSPNKITFNTYFSFINRLPPKIIRFTIFISNESSFPEDTEKEESECLIVGEPIMTKEIIKYNCEASKKDGEIGQIVVNPDFKFEYNNGTIEEISPNLKDIYFSEEAKISLENLEIQTQEINNMFILDKGQLRIYPTYFFIMGDIDKYKGKVGDELRLVVIYNYTVPAIPQNIYCITESVQGIKYEFKCSPAQDVRGSLYLAPMYIGDTSITLNMTDNLFFYLSSNTSSNSTPSSNPSIQLLEFNSYNQPSPNKITFNTYFSFINRLPAKIIRFTLTILYGSSLQGKKVNETTECLIVGEPIMTNETVQYKCEASKEDTGEIEQVVVNRDLKLESANGTIEEISPNSSDIKYSEEAIASSQNLKNQTQVINEMFILEKGELIKNSTYFIIKGDIDKYKGKVGDELRLVIYNNYTVPAIPQNVSCITESVQGIKYEFKCSPNQDLRGSLYLSQMHIGITSITLNIIDNLDYSSPSTPASNPSIQLLEFNSYNQPSPTKITFNTYFSFTNRLPAKIIRFALTILYGSSLQGKKVNETAECLIVGEPNMADKISQYNCEAPKEEVGEIDQVIVNKGDFQLLDSGNSTMVEISPNFSEEAASASQNLKNQTKTINNMLMLENGELIIDYEYFIIMGDIDKYNGKEGEELTLAIYNNNNEPPTPQNVPCLTESVQGIKYEFKCTPSQDVKGSLYLSQMHIGNTSITLNMTDNLDYYSPSTPGSTRSIQILEFNSFKIASPTSMTFNVYFSFINRLPPKIIRFTLTLLYESNLQEKEVNETAECLIVGEPTMTDDIVQYNCEAPKENGEIEQVIVNKDDFRLEYGYNGTMEEITPNFSEEADSAAQNLQEQTKVIKKMLKLENGELIIDSTYFIIRGDIDNYDGKTEQNLTLVIYDNRTYPSTPTNVSCITQSVKDTKYEFKCTPSQDVKGSLYLSPMYIGDTSITLNMTSPNSDYFSGYKTTPISDSNSTSTSISTSVFDSTPASTYTSTNLNSIPASSFIPTSSKGTIPVSTYASTLATTLSSTQPFAHTSTLSTISASTQATTLSSTQPLAHTSTLSTTSASTLATTLSSTQPLAHTSTLSTTSASTLATTLSSTQVSANSLSTSILTPSSNFTSTSVSSSKIESTSTPNYTSTSTPGATPTSLPTTPVTKNNKDASIQVLGFNSFISESKRITFTTFFYFYQRIPPRIIRFSLTILYGRRLRHLQEAVEESECLIVGDSTTITDENIKYNCEAPKKEGIEIEQIVINPDIKLVNADGTVQEILVTSGDINFSEEAALGSQNLQKQNKQISNSVKLENGELKINSKDFVIIGNIDKYNGKVGDNLTLVVYDNRTNPSTANNVPCKTENIEGTKYEFKCTPSKEVKGTIYLSPMYSGNTSIILNMTEPNSYTIDFIPNTNNSEIGNNPIYKKSSSGLSGGAIAGIVIACVVGALIIIGIFGYILTRQCKRNINSETPSVIGLRTVDNLDQ